LSYTVKRFDAKTELIALEKIYSGRFLSCFNIVFETDLLVHVLSDSGGKPLDLLSESGSQSEAAASSVKGEIGESDAVMQWKDIPQNTLIPNAATAAAADNDDVMEPTSDSALDTTLSVAANLSSKSDESLKNIDGDVGHHSNTVAAKSNISLIKSLLRHLTMLLDFLEMLLHHDYTDNSAIAGMSVCLSVCCSLSVCLFKSGFVVSLFSCLCLISAGVCYDSDM